ncbi:uncharacterized protein LOC133819841 isoform X4 [Humulus lupulus]|uniref:uncharacterized protein LOC133819841 isoform X4 n=1 Tax=Humulus lupulus TaxID=3486 RepID=UPI002B40B221|nr:uncharacterized protein LOC133819841 isoform X4 [Humulus lupulus]XP_062109186.1 uncharacterized protein LOC133819841 isoform X4 [Humulus lupulus]
MADAMISALVEQLASDAIGEVKQQVGMVMGVRKEVSKLTDNLKAIEAVLLDVERRQVHDSFVAYWFAGLKEVLYDMDNVLDEWNTIILKSKIKGKGKEGESTNYNNSVPNKGCITTIYGH